MLPGITYCSFYYSYEPCEVWGWKEKGRGLRQEKRNRKRGKIPPDFLAPNRFLGPSLALFTAPCCACEAWRTNIRIGEDFEADWLIQEKTSC